MGIFFTACAIFIYLSKRTLSAVRPKLGSVDKGEVNELLQGIIGGGLIATIEIGIIVVLCWVIKKWVIFAYYNYIITTIITMVLANFDYKLVFSMHGAQMLWLLNLIIDTFQWFFAISLQLLQSKLYSANL